MTVTSARSEASKVSELQFSKQRLSTVLQQSRCREGSAVTVRAQRNFDPREGEGGEREVMTKLPANFLNLG